MLGDQNCFSENPGLCSQLTSNRIQTDFPPELGDQITQQHDDHIESERLTNVFTRKVVHPQHALRERLGSDELDMTHPVDLPITNLYTAPKNAVHQPNPDDVFLFSERDA